MLAFVSKGAVQPAQLVHTEDFRLVEGAAAEVHTVVINSAIVLWLSV